ncbi:MAG TPA: hypothetical protein VM242_07940 [Acidimicrobiales bacterium]|nr:hypothetical protein [Acidimicrobiales bacterium]
MRSDDPLVFVADACAAAAVAVSEPRSWRPSDAAMIDLYAELVVAYACPVRTDLSGTRLAIVDHLVGRVAQARSGEIKASLVDIVRPPPRRVGVRARAGLTSVAMVSSGGPGSSSTASVGP